MANTSATGGYLSPTTANPFPGGLTLTQFIQTVIVGITGLPGVMVRPTWQVAPPIQPDISTNWIAFGIAAAPADANAYVGMDKDGIETLQRNEYLTINCSIYGPDAYENMGNLRDGFQIPQNLAAMTAAKMGFIATGLPNRSPDLVNARWIDRFTMEIQLVRLIQRTYAVLPFVSAQGTILTDNGNSLDWIVEEGED